MVDEARQELVQTLPQPMEEMIVSDLLVRIVTWVIVVIYNMQGWETIKCTL